MSITDSRPANQAATPRAHSSAGPDSLGGQTRNDIQPSSAAEGQDSPQATASSAPMAIAPAGSNASRSHVSPDTQTAFAAAENVPGGQCASGTQRPVAAGDQASAPTMVPTTPNVEPSARDDTSPAATGISRPISQTPPGNQAPLAANRHSTPIELAPLADPLLALAADVLDDLEKVRIANENRLRQLTRSDEDSDGETRGFGLDESHPDVARLAALVGMLADAEHKAELNLKRVMRKHPLGPWVARQKGVGEKQAARLIAAIGDPYIRPEIALEDGTVEPSRPRMVSELWALCGYHVIPVGHPGTDNQPPPVGGELNGSGPGHSRRDGQTSSAGVAPKRQRGQRANWSATAKMRAYLVAESCMKQRESPYRTVYDATRAKYAEAVHAAECVRCGPKGKPAQPGSPLSDGHKLARALRAVAKEVLRDLWREAKRIHEELPSAAKSCSAPIPVALLTDD